MRLLSLSSPKDGTLNLPYDHCKALADFKSFSGEEHQEERTNLSASWIQRVEDLRSPGRGHASIRQVHSKRADRITFSQDVMQMLREYEAGECYEHGYDTGFYGDDFYTGNVATSTA